RPPGSNDPNLLDHVSSHASAAPRTQAHPPAAPHRSKLSRRPTLRQNFPKARVLMAASLPQIRRAA
ncbi:MAG: hypothetical protein ACK5CW_16900, partial [Verrucomicrobiota bacterium]